MLKSMRETSIIFLRTIGLIWRNSKMRVVAVLVTSIISGCLMPIGMLINKWFLDELSSSIVAGLFSPVIVACVLTLFFFSLLSSLVDNFLSVTKENMADGMALVINGKILDKCVVLPMKDYDDKETYDTIRMATVETPMRSVSFIDIVSGIIKNIVQLCGVIGIVISFNWLVVVICVAATIPLFCLNRYTSRFHFKIAVQRMEQQRYADTLKNIVLKNDHIKELKLFGVGTHLKGIIMGQEARFYSENKANRRRFALFSIGSSSLNDLINLGIKLWIVFISIMQRLSLGSINLYLASVDNVKASVQGIVGQIANGYEQTLYLNSLFVLLDMECEEEHHQYYLDEPIETIEFKTVSFTYPGASFKALDNVSLSIKKGTTYGLVGLNGSGKTTLIKLLLGLYTPDEGEILINGRRLDNLEVESVWKKFSAIFQDFIKYPSSVQDNIIFGDLCNFDSERLQYAARYSGAAEFIEKLPNAFSTQLQKEWTEGAELSQGQWQKIALARCIYRAAEAYIFDEPFASLDALAEKEILKNMKQTKRDALCLFVTHRYSSLSLADELIVMRDGKIIECGTHQTLIANPDSYYSELYYAQAEPILKLNDQILNEADTYSCYSEGT